MGPRGARVRVDFDPIWSYPKPVQKPHPPILIGGESEHTLRRVVQFGDGWLPRGRGGEGPVLAALAELRSLATQAGRDPQTISATVFGARPEAAVLGRYAAAGVTRAIPRLPSEGREAILPLLDRYATLIR